MYTLSVSSQFKTDIKIYKKTAKIIAAIQQVVDFLLGQKKLSVMYHDHELKGSFAGVRECHIADLLLMYEIDRIKQVVRLIRIWSHSELFG